MVATRKLNLGPPIPASPARLKANPAKSPYIHAWLGDFPSEGISNKAGELATKLASIGYDSLSSLHEMESEEAPSQLAALGILAIHAQMIIRDARAIHHKQGFNSHSTPLHVRTACGACRNETSETIPRLEWADEHGRNAYLQLP